ncbi:hypothetical protein PYW07_000469 [Mythimna separata]|uniref:Neural proliferation differentiation and control protein 1 n=1 Tax=Mythimna separata TaxID=271217 RepID=A0AAD8E0G0_MYTSE|nr:hypothetical protein PYW07_000469 [Mythimna separata]
MLIFSIGGVQRIHRSASLCGAPYKRSANKRRERAYSKVLVLEIDSIARSTRIVIEKDNARWAARARAPVREGIKSSSRVEKLGHFVHGDKKFDVGGVSIGAERVRDHSSTAPGSKQKARRQHYQWSGRGMHTLIVLLLVAAAACAVPRPLGPSAAPSLSQLPHRMGRPPRPFRSDYIMPRMLMPNPLYMYEDNLRAVAPTEQDWLSKEIDRINQMDDEEDLTPFEEEFSRWISREPYAPPFGAPQTRDADVPETVTPVPEEIQPLPLPKEIIQPESIPAPEAPVQHQETSTAAPPVPINNEEKKKTFALTPLDNGYYEPEQNPKPQESEGPHEGGEGDSMAPQEPVNAMALQPPRQIRQNPNLGRTKNLVADNLDRLRTGFTHENPAGTDKPRHIHVLESTADPADSIYGIALIAAVGTALTMAIIGFAFGWYTLSKKAKAAADVDYPAYGVTGPNIDTSGDRKLAHSAHMYHYQHQKQQIIAMERNGCEHRNGSVSDPESEEENEEGDYTVYECPGFATTGEMEVKNPLFSEDPTPATPGKCEIVKPQPKD